MCNQAQSVTLQTAVLMTVKEFAQQNQTFSVHDITRTIRSKASQGDLEIPEVEVSGASFRFDIPHSRVKALFLEMWNSGVFDPDFTLTRNFNKGGGYFEYSPVVPAANAVYASTTSTATTPAPTTPSYSKNNAPVQDRVVLYLNNCATRNFRPTLKQVQSAIKRGDASTGWSCEDLQKLIETTLGYSVVADPESLSASQVVTV